jgi:hypothetical protein
MKMIKILLLTANPVGTKSLETYKEIHEIRQSIQTSKYSSNFEVIPKDRLNRSEILKFIEDEKPSIVHFSGHGSSGSELYLEDEFGQIQLLEKEAIKDIFSISKEGIKCVFLNACYTEPQANAIAEVIDGVVIGTVSSISDISAISFSKEFYRQVANEQDIYYAYKAACLQSRGGKDLFRMCSPNVNPSNIRFHVKPTSNNFDFKAAIVGAAIAKNPEDVIFKSDSGESMSDSAHSTGNSGDIDDDSEDSDDDSDGIDDDSEDSDDGSEDMNDDFDNMDDDDFDD